jgi:hypothetical protein
MQQSLPLEIIEDIKDLCLAFDGSFIPLEKILLHLIENRAEAKSVLLLKTFLENNISLTYEHVLKAYEKGMLWGRRARSPDHVTSNHAHIPTLCTYSCLNNS